MAGDLLAFSAVSTVRKQAAVERDRIVAIMAATDELQAARLAAMDDTLSEAGEFLALQRLDKAEASVLNLIVDPGFRVYQQHLLRGLTAFVEGAA